MHFYHLGHKPLTRTNRKALAASFTLLLTLCGASRASTEKALQVGLTGTNEVSIFAIFMAVVAGAIGAWLLMRLLGTEDTKTGDENRTNEAQTQVKP